MDIILLNVDCVLEFWSQQCAYLLANVASMRVFVFDEHGSDSTCGPDFITLLSFLTLSCFSSQSFYNHFIIAVFVSPSSVHPLHTTVIITSLLPPGGRVYSHITVLVAPGLVPCNVFAEFFAKCYSEFVQLNVMNFCLIT